MASLPVDDDDTIDEALFQIFKKEKIQELKSKLTGSILKDIKNQKGLLADFYDCKHSDFGGFKSRLQSVLGCSMNDKLAVEISQIFDKYCISKPKKEREESEKMLFEILKLVVGVSPINNNQLCTPICTFKRKDDEPICPELGNHRMKKFLCAEKENHFPRKVLFEPASKFNNHPRKKKSSEVEFVKENTLNRKLNKMCSNAEDFYNTNFVTAKGRSDAMNEGSPALSFVSGVFSDTVHAASVAGAQCSLKSSKFPIIAQQKKFYDVVCLLANGTHSMSVIVNIGGCFLNCFSLGDYIAPGHEVCNFVVNCMCRKFFLDERPTISLKHYFFSTVSDVLMSDCKDYSFVGHCFNGAARVLPLTSCKMLFFPVLHGDHWFLFVVDLGEMLFVFLDSLFSKTDGFSVRTRKKLIVNFCHAWRMFVGSDPGFKKFRIAYPHVPKQMNTVDWGVFLMKFMQLWELGVNLQEQKIFQTFASRS